MFTKRTLNAQKSYKNVKLFIKIQSISLFFDIKKVFDFLKSTELIGCVTWFKYFLVLLEVRYGCANFSHCRTYVIDFRNQVFFAPLPYVSSPEKAHPEKLMVQVKKYDLRASILYLYELMPLADFDWYWCDVISTY